MHVKSTSSISRTTKATGYEYNTTEVSTLPAPYAILEAVAISAPVIIEALERWKVTLSAFTISSKSLVVGRKLGEGT